ncbi:hypothetical protein LTR37_016180 [Vermiconidia calcicola]|uniref:Uncharacterized protein n=1 Tax=Vermiconidia calcicola TaxID=1690605 RepID=A0ACC3MPT2_9PEZI|nr:hypothetical protein LTR37_016180 [Vermiconidia calcicola]
MATAAFVPISIILLTLVYLALQPASRSPPEGSRYPPGPEGKPLIGNLQDLDLTQALLASSQEVADQYGPVMRLTLAGREHYVVSTEKVANDLLRERGSIYSSRAQAPASAQLLPDNLRPVLLPYNEIVQQIVAVNHNLERIASPGAYLVDTFPILMKLPRFLAPFKREIEELHRREHSLFRGLLEDVRERMKDGTAPKCWERDFLENQSEFNLTDDKGAYVVGTMFEAGSGTTSAAMMSFVLAMVLHPLWFRKVQEEVDSVCGAERMPYLDDVRQLPIVRAVIKETLRWRPVTAGGLPHMSTKDDVYEGLFIPANTVIHPNQWAIHREPELYPQPESYLPERWLDSSYRTTFKSPLSVYPNLHNYSNFGFGRRICPRQNIAERNLYLLAARIAWAANISKAKDGEGNEIDPPLNDYTAGFNAQPKWFPFELQVRSQERWAVIEEELKRGAESEPLK